MKSMKSKKKQGVEESRGELWIFECQEESRRVRVEEIDNSQC